MLYLARPWADGLQRRGALPGLASRTARRDRAEQARGCTDALAVAPATLVSSDIERARETAAIVGCESDSSPWSTTFAETDAGEWTDREFADVLAEDPQGIARFAALDMEWGFPGGELPRSAERVLPRSLIGARARIVTPSSWSVTETRSGSRWCGAARAR